MTITCPSCASRFALPSEKIPKTAFRVACGKCKHQFMVNPASAPQGPPSFHGAGLSPVAPVAAAAEPGEAPPGPGDGPLPAAPPSPIGPLPGDREVHPAPVEEFQEGLRLSMVCDDRLDRQEGMSAALRELGYKPHVAPRPREALAWLYQHRYEVILIHEDFGGGPPAHNPLVVGLAALPMSQRRHFCVGLVGKNIRTMDNVTAFHHSVHFVVNERDLPRLKSIVRSAIAENDAFYRVFREVLRQVGKT